MRIIRLRLTWLGEFKLIRVGGRIQMPVLFLVFKILIRTGVRFTCSSSKCYVRSPKIQATLLFVFLQMF